MKITIIGAGGVGGVVAGNLARAGYNPSIIARGAHLKAIQQSGLTLEIQEKDQPTKTETFKIRATDNPSELGIQDIVIISVKGQDIPDALAKAKQISDAKTILVPIMNGIPWWYLEELAVRSPQLAVSKEKLTADCQLLIAGVIYISTGIKSPGAIDYRGGRRLMFGQPDGGESTALKTIIEIFEKAGMRPIATNNIKKEIWLKLWGNISFNPLSVICGKGMADISTDPELREQARGIMTDMKKITDALKIDLGITIDQRLEEGRKSGNHKTSMLQDYESGKKLELEGIIEYPIKIAEKLNIPVPALKALLKKMQTISK